MGSVPTKPSVSGLAAADASDDELEQRVLAYQYQGDGVLRLTEHERPTPDEGEVTVEVTAAGICGTDLKIARGEHRLYPPGTVRIPGHESVGVIAENASAHADLAPGTPVAIAPNIACGTCRACLAGRENLCENYSSVGLTIDGGFARVVRIPARAVEAGNVMPLPSGLDPETAALTEPVAAVVRGLRPLNLGATDTVLVCGAGPIGLIAVILAKAAGMDRVIVSQTSAPRRALAREFGADVVIDPRAGDLAEQVLGATDGWGADAVVAAAPVPQLFADVLHAAAKGARVNFFAGLPSGQGVVPLDANLVHYRELTVTGSTANTNADCREALQVVAATPELFAPLITHRFQLEEAGEAFAAASSGEGLKVLLRPQQ